MSSARKQLLEKWLKENKLKCSEELGDLVKRVNSTLASIVYLRSNSDAKVIQCLDETDRLDLRLYSKTGAYKNLLRLVLRHKNAEKAGLISRMFVSEENHLEDIYNILDVYRESKQPCPSFIVDVLKRNLPEDGPLQTLCLRINLAHAPQVADAILGDQVFKYYNRPRIAELCEEAGLLQRALENYEDLTNIKRVVVQTNLLNHEWLVEFFGKLSSKNFLLCLKTLLRINNSQNLHLSLQIATKYYCHASEPVIDLFYPYGGSYYVLKQLVKSSQDRELHFKYIQAACEAGQLDEVERMCRESNHIDLERVQNYLEQVNLADQLPMFIVCARMREMRAANPTT